MKTFNDNAGRTWTVAINGECIKRVKTLLSVNLLDAIEGKLIDFGKQTEVPCHDLVHELLDFVDEVVDDLGTRKEMDYIKQMLERGSGADRQLAVWEQSNELESVVDYIINETHHGLGI